MVVSEAVSPFFPNVLGGRVVGMGIAQVYCRRAGHVPPVCLEGSLGCDTVSHDVSCRLPFRDADTKENERKETVLQCSLTPEGWDVASSWCYLDSLVACRRLKPDGTGTWRRSAIRISMIWMVWPFKFLVAEFGTQVNPIRIRTCQVKQTSLF